MSHGNHRNLQLRLRQPHRLYPPPQARQSKPCANTVTRLTNSGGVLVFCWNKPSSSQPTRRRDGFPPSCPCMLLP